MYSQYTQYFNIHNHTFTKYLIPAGILCLFFISLYNIYKKTLPEDILFTNKTLSVDILSKNTFPTLNILQDSKIVLFSFQIKTEASMIISLNYIIPDFLIKPNYTFSSGYFVFIHL